jgi:4-hydroxymandelate oxidase
METPPLNLQEVEAAALAALPQMVRDYFAGGAGDEITLRACRAALERVTLRPRVLVDVSKRSQSVRVLGSEIAAPVLVAPMAFQRLAHDEGEIATARAAKAAGTVMILSTLATCRMEDVVAAAAPSKVWFQLYVFKDRAATQALVERAEKAGCAAIVVTVDAPYLGRRERDVRNRFGLPEGIHIANLTGFGKDELPPQAQGSGLGRYFEEQLDASFSWKDLAWLRKATSLPIVLKGVLRADDAERATDAGVAGLVVSNHGGRQLDGSIASIDALPAVADAAGSSLEVYVDGGIRRGTDVVKALALGARAVLLGRPVLWGLATGGEDGVRNVLSLLSAEIDLAMALCGARTADDVTRDLVG